MSESHFQGATGESLLASSKLLFLYGGAGAVGTAFHFGVLFATLSLMGPVLASTLGAVVGCIVNYVLAKQFVFASTESYRQSFPRFVTVAVVGIAVNAAVIKAFVGVLPIVINQTIASGIVLLLGYSLNRCWTFNDR